MESARLKRFAQFARRSLLDQVGARLHLVLAEHSMARREQPGAVAELEKAVEQHGKEQIVERAAYTWFNRLCALRFMDVNRYNRIGVLSPAQGQFQPEILAEAKMGHIDEELVADAAVRDRIFGLLRGQITSNDPQGEAYGLLLLAVCTYWHRAMPFLFQRIDDYTRLLLPEDLLSGSSIPACTREAMTPDACKDVEVIGWLYQFYISEKKEAVFEGLKKNKKITPEDIPAATQLFTPHWVVRYLVENSLGRLWMLNHPDSGLAARMDYYIRPEQPEQDFLRIHSPEEIRVCDPACGSGHMLTYAFDLLYAIYEEEGYTPSDIPEKILTHNLYGVEIDERAGALAAFALSMKARARQRGFFRKPVQPHICVLQNVAFSDDELGRYMDALGRDLFTVPLVTGLHQFAEADNFGSLIRPDITDAAGIRKRLEKKEVGRNLLLQATHEKVLRVLEQSEYLSPHYHVVIANPPYMGSKNMNARLGAWVKEKYPDSKSDLFATFMERNFELVQRQGMVGMITMQSWMFLSSFETLRSRIAGQRTILSMAHLGARAFDSIGGEVVSTTAFVVSNAAYPEYKGDYIRLVDGKSEEEKNNALLEAVRNPTCGWFFRASAADFKKIPGSPIAYWTYDFNIFNNKKLGENWFSGGRLKTHNGDLFIRFLWEVSSSNKKWVRLIKGGEFRRHFGNEEFVVDWSDEAINFYTKNGGLYPQDYRKRNGICWSKITSGISSFRIKRDVTEYDSASPTIYNNIYMCDYFILSLLNSCVANYLIRILNPTLNTQISDVMSIPVCTTIEKKLKNLIECAEKKLIFISSQDWDSYETSWDFTSLPLLFQDYRRETLAATYAALREHWQEMTLEMQRLEEENNRIFIEAYGLQEELTPDVPLPEITLTCNPHYRYGGDRTEEELEALLLADTMKEFISYAVGCMFGRYALEKPGLVLANQGETLADYLAQVPEPSFPADADNVIPLLEGEWFSDDITGRFQNFVRLTFGEEHLEDNLAFIEKALGKSIRKYFVRDFYADHVKRYKKRPIYWLFSSSKGSFNALIYMHRYTPDTVGTVLNDYVREFQTKLQAEKALQESIEISSSTSPAEKNKAAKKLDSIRKMLKELEDYERDTLYPLASQHVAIDLDDGVKVNYPKFGAALKKVPGLDAREE